MTLMCIHIKAIIRIIKGTDRERVWTQVKQCQRRLAAVDLEFNDKVIKVGVIIIEAISTCFVFLCNTCQKSCYHTQGIHCLLAAF